SIAAPYVAHAQTPETEAVRPASDVEHTPETMAQATSAPATPVHTGFRSLAKDTARDFLAFPKRRSTWVILGIGAAGAALAHPADQELNARLAGSSASGKFFAAGKYVGSAYTQIGVSLGLYTIGRFVVPHANGEPQTNKWSHMGFDLLRAQIVSQALVHGIKYTVRRDRPTGECCAFPSGHAATAFAAASVIERHFGYRFAWPTVLAATYVGASRLHDNRHYLSDVVFGAALGTATGWTIVGRHGRDAYALVPTPVRGGVAISLTRVYR
ncbi:MAG TPA: phosphatase PAP2 family protein, partial [Vicinamibacterales bacterium]|nr:phosphatase PAP2 family protein [Vicinamibacterales bacterium]